MGFRLDLSIEYCYGKSTFRKYLLGLFLAYIVENAKLSTRQPPAIEKVRATEQSQAVGEARFPTAGDCFCRAPLTSISTGRDVLLWDQLRLGIFSGGSALFVLKF